MVTALVLRGVAFEFRFKAQRWQSLWDMAFAVGSILASFCQGLTLGAVVQGIPVFDGSYAGASYDWLTPFTVATGIGVMMGYTLLGSGWLIMKTTGTLQAFAYCTARRTLFGMLFFIALVSIWTPFAQPAIADRWFSLPNFYYLAPVPLATLLIAAGAWWSRTQRRVVVIGGGFGGLAAVRSLKAAPVHITLIDRRNFHLFQPLLYQVATGQLSPADIASPLRAVVGRQRNVSVLESEVVDILTDEQRVVLREGESVPYDTLVLSAGSTSHYFGRNEWAALATAFPRSLPYPDPIAPKYSGTSAVPRQPDNVVMPGFLGEQTQ